MKIVRMNKTNRESENDILVAENIQDPNFGAKMVDALTMSFTGPFLPAKFELVPDDFVLYTIPSNPQPENRNDQPQPETE